MMSENVQSILISREELEVMLGMSRRSIWKAELKGQMPRGLRIMRRPRWRRAEIEAWVAAGCPATKEWVWEGDRSDECVRSEA